MSEREGGIRAPILGSVLDDPLRRAQVVMEALGGGVEADEVERRAMNAVFLRRAHRVDVVHQQHVPRLARALGVEEG